MALWPLRALSLLVFALAIPQLTSAQTNLQHLPPPSSRSPTEQAPDEHTLGGGGVGGGSVQVHGDSVLLVATLDGDVHAVAGSTGELLWSLDAGGPLIGSSAFDLGSLFATDAAEPPPGAEATGAFASPSAPTQRDPGSGSSGGAWADVASAEKARREAARSSEARGEGGSEPDGAAGGGGVGGGKEEGEGGEGEGEGGAGGSTGGALVDGEAEEILVVPGLDGSIFLLDEESEELVRLTEARHALCPPRASPSERRAALCLQPPATLPPPTADLPPSPRPPSPPSRLAQLTVQDLVAAPTTFTDGGLLLGSKSSTLFSLQPDSGRPLYFATGQDAAADSAAEEEAEAPSERRSAARRSEARQLGEGAEGGSGGGGGGGEGGVGEGECASEPGPTSGAEEARAGERPSAGELLISR